MPLHKGTRISLRVSEHKQLGASPANGEAIEERRWLLALVRALAKTGAGR